jgi:hypothetical protein
MPEKWVGYLANVTLARMAVTEIVRELQDAVMQEESAWDRFFSSLAGDSLAMIRKYMNSYLQRSEEREAIERRLELARTEEVYRSTLHSSSVETQREQHKIRSIKDGN